MTDMENEGGQIRTYGEVARNIKDAADGCDWRDETGTSSLGSAGLCKTGAYGQHRGSGR